MVKPCIVCSEPTEDDGYGEPVHADSNLYWHGDRAGNLGHVARV